MIRDKYFNSITGFNRQMMITCQRCASFNRPNSVYPNLKSVHFNFSNSTYENICKITTIHYYHLFALSLKDNTLTSNS